MLFYSGVGEGKTVEPFINLFVKSFFQNENDNDSLLNSINVTKMHPFFCLGVGDSVALTTGMLKSSLVHPTNTVLTMSPTEHHSIGPNTEIHCSR